MNLKQLTAEFREQMGDRAAPYLISPERAVILANRAQVEACRRSLLLEDSTSDICELGYAINEHTLTIDPRIIQIREAIISGQSIPLMPVNRTEMQLLAPGWRTAVSQQYPMYYIRDYASNQIRLYPPSLIAGTVILSVYREPLEEMKGNDDEPEIPARYHYPLIYHMVELATANTSDAEVYNPDAAARAARKFATEFGQPVSARNEKWVSRQGVGLADTLA